MTENEFTRIAVSADVVQHDDGTYSLVIQLSGFKHPESACRFGRMSEKPVKDALLTVFVACGGDPEWGILQ